MADYNEEVLKYPQIGYALDPIYRPRPEPTRFNIPALTGDYNTKENASDEKRTPQQSGNLVNADKDIGIESITASSYVTIKVPRELTSYLNGHVTTKGTSVYKNSHSYDTSSSGGETHSHSVSIGGRGYSEQREEEYDMWNEDDTIPAGSAWIIVFVGGDISYPVVIARYYDDKYKYDESYKYYKK